MKTSPSSSFNLRVYSIFLLTLLGVIFVGICCLYIQKHFLSKRSVLVVYDALDSDSHTATVTALAQVIIACKLGTVETYNMFQAECPDLISYDVILFINSDNIVRNLAHFQDEYVIDVPPILGFLKSRLQEISKIRCVQFDYTNGSPKIPYLHQDNSAFNKRALSVPKDIKLLIRWLAGKLHKLYANERCYMLHNLPQIETLLRIVMTEVARRNAEMTANGEVIINSECGSHSDNFLPLSSVSAVVNINEETLRF